MRYTPLMKSIMLALALTVASAQTTAPDKPAAAVPKVSDKATIEIVTIVVSKGADTNVMRRAYGIPGGEAIKAGTLIVARASLPGKTIIAAPESLRVTTFADDHATDLGSGKQSKSVFNDNSIQTAMAPDGKSCLFWVYSSHLPATGAGQITLKGTLPLHVGIGEKTVEIKNPQLKLGRKIVAGDTTLEVQTLAADSDQSGLAVTFSSQDSMAGIKGFEFYDARGKPLAAAAQSHSYGYRRANDGTNLASVVISRRVPVASMKVLFYEKTESIQLPVDVKIKIGL